MDRFPKDWGENKIYLKPPTSSSFSHKHSHVNSHFPIVGRGNWRSNPVGPTITILGAGHLRFVQTGKSAWKKRQWCFASTRFRYFWRFFKQRFEFFDSKCQSFSSFHSWHSLLLPVSDDQLSCELWRLSQRSALDIGLRHKPTNNQSSLRHKAPCIVSVCGHREALVANFASVARLLARPHKNRYCISDRLWRCQGNFLLCCLTESEPIKNQKACMNSLESGQESFHE